MDFIGHRIGNFLLSEKIGEGTFAEVFLAEHVFLDRKKAIKILREEAAANPALVLRFENEAMAACACQHDHIVVVEDCGTTTLGGSSWHYIEMEYLEGMSLGLALCPPHSPEGRMVDIDRVVRIVGTVADALATTHARGIVHRDLHPGNIFLARRAGRPDHVKVLDFGAARLTDSVLASGSPTRTGLVIGTEGYMSPEQARGLHPDGKSDVFNLGVVLYRMLTGEPPFHDDNDSVLRLKIINDQPVPVTRRRPGVPANVARAVELAMDKSPAARPTMRELRELLLDSDAAPRPIRDDVTTSTPVARSVPPAITIDPARVRTASDQPTAHGKRRD